MVRKARTRPSRHPGRIAWADTADRKQQQISRWGSGQFRGYPCAGDRKPSQSVLQARLPWQRKGEMQIRMILQIAPDAGAIEPWRYADFLQFISRPNSRTQQYRR